MVWEFNFLKLTHKRTSLFFLTTTLGKANGDSDSLMTPKSRSSLRVLPYCVCILRMNRPGLLLERRAVTEVDAVLYFIGVAIIQIVQRKNIGHGVN